jgi:hypothetical protein
MHSSLRWRGSGLARNRAFKSSLQQQAVSSNSGSVSGVELEVEFEAKNLSDPPPARSTRLRTASVTSLKFGCCNVTAVPRYSTVTYLNATYCNVSGDSTTEAAASMSTVYFRGIQKKHPAAGYYS